MISYLLLDKDGAVRQRGQCFTEDDIPKVPGMKSEVIAGDDPRQPFRPVRDTFADVRRMAYPNDGDQFDAIWDVLVQAGLIDKSPKAKAVFDQVKAVKQRFPKS